MRTAGGGASFARESDEIPGGFGVSIVFVKRAKDDRSFHFLVGTRGLVAGMISAANLNCRIVRVYLFNVISELEISLAQFVDSSSLDILSYLATGSGERRRTLDRFNADRVNGVDAPVVEYLRLVDLFNLGIRAGLPSVVGMPDKILRSIRTQVNELRNRVAHPTRSLISEPSDARDLWPTLTRAQEIQLGLRRCLTTTCG